jgi:hypothetical protein
VKQHGKKMSYNKQAKGGKISTVARKKKSKKSKSKKY